MAHISYITKGLKKYLLNTEAIILFMFVVSIYYYMFHAESVWNFLERVKIKIALKLSGKYDKLPSNGDRDLTIEKSKASWELKKGNVGVFAIQGRRPHMEDRFNVVNDLEHTDTSIYGIFDGHGGEVSTISGFSFLLPQPEVS